MSNVLSLEGNKPKITIKVNSDENWFTKAIENLENNKEAFSSEEE